MTKPITGQCLCGSIKFQCDEEKLAGGAVCHCRDCQYVSGGGPAMVVVTPEDDFTLLQGEPKSFTVTGESGSDVTRKFCGDCGSPILSELGIAPGIKIIKIGTFDDPSFFNPQMTVWTSTAQPWAHIDAGIPSFPKSPG